MYAIRKGECDEKTMVTEVIGVEDKENRVFVTWKWPKLAELEFCIAFDLEEDLPLEEILRRGYRGTVYEEEFGVRHMMELDHPCQLVKIFAARRLPDRRYELVNQTGKNSSDLFYRKVQLVCSVQYAKENLFSSKKTAMLQLQGLSELREPYILYRCVGGSRAGFVYPVDVQKFGCQASFIIPLEKREEVVLELTEAQKKYITIVIRK